MPFLYYACKVLLLIRVFQWINSVHSCNVWSGWGTEERERLLNYIRYGKIRESKTKWIIYRKEDKRTTLGIIDYKTI